MRRRRLRQGHPDLEHRPVIRIQDIEDYAVFIRSLALGRHVAKFGQQTPMGRPGQPEEVAPCYVFLASDDSSYMTGQVLHPNGGEIVNT